MTLNDTVNLISSKAFYNLSDLETIKVSKERAFMEVFMLFYQQQ